MMPALPFMPGMPLQAMIKINKTGGNAYERIKQN
jgi:hypothetical protein